MTRQLKMVIKQTIRRCSTQRHHSYQQTIAAMFTQNDNGPDFHHLRHFIASEIANQHAALLGLVSKRHPWHSLEKRRVCAKIERSPKADPLREM
ncbi:hypothetical protein BJN42_04035 [Pseudomonas koreensis]|nr:hypothetical protein BJN42_04035 [Pseudomonas koreensis]